MQRSSRGIPKRKVRIAKELLNVTECISCSLFCNNSPLKLHNRKLHDAKLVQSAGVSYAVVAAGLLGLFRLFCEGSGL